MLVPAEKAVKLQLEKRLQEEQMKEERMQDVLLLLDHLVQREEPTVKIILNCLYDVATINLINKYVRYSSLNRASKRITAFLKPVGRFAGWQWFKRNCPQLITDWLRTKVSF